MLIDRMRIMDCGCHYDVSGLCTLYCEEHDPEQTQKHLIQITDQDSFSMDIYMLKVHENGQADKIKATLALGSHFQLKALLRDLLESCDVDPEKDDLTNLNLAWVWEE